MEKRAESFLNSESNLKKIIFGSILSIILTIISLIIFSCLITYTSIQESTIPTVTIIITATSILIGSMVTSYNLKKNGIINGATIGFIYILFIYFLSSIIKRNFTLNTNSLIMIGTAIGAGALGGIIGINKGNKKLT